MNRAARILQLISGIEKTVSILWIPNLFTPMSSCDSPSLISSCPLRMIAGMSPHTRSLYAVMGFLELGMPDDAWEELESLPPGQHDQAEVRELRIAISMRLEKWQAARIDAETMARRHPDNPSWWISWAYALRRETSIHEARKILLQAAKLHPGELMILYNLACYASVLGELEEARNLLKRVVSEDSDFREMALKDPDLIPVFASDDTGGSSE